MLTNLLMSIAKGSKCTALAKSLKKLVTILRIQKKA